MCVCACVWRLENAVWRRFSVVVLHLLCNLTGHWLFHFCQLVQVHFNCNFLHHYFLSWGGRVCMLQKRLLSSLEPVSRCMKENQLVFLLFQPSIDCYWSNGANKYMCSPFGHVTVLIIFPNIFRCVYTYTQAHAQIHRRSCLNMCLVAGRWFSHFPVLSLYALSIYPFCVCMYASLRVCVYTVCFVLRNTCRHKHT